MSTIARTVQLFKDRALSPAALSERLVARARAERDKVVSAGQAPPSWRTYVDGHEATAEDGAKQSVLYRFDLLAQWWASRWASRLPARRPVAAHSVEPGSWRWTGSAGPVT